MTQKTNTNPWTMDVRVRERNLKSGALTDKDLEKYLAALPDVADQADAFGTSQPALAQHAAPPPPPAPVVIAETSSVEEEDDEEDEDEEDEVGIETTPEQVDGQAEPAAPAEENASNGEGELP